MVPIRSRCLVLLLTLAFTLAGPNVPTARATGTDFPDVAPSASYAEAVRQLTTLGVIRGYPNGTFRPPDQVLRAQVAVTIVRAFDWATQTLVRDFPDQGSVDPESWAAVRLLADREVARGYLDGTFRPTRPVTRQEAISFITRTMVLQGEWEVQPTTRAYSDTAPAHAADVATYVRYVGAVPQVGSPAAGTTSMGAAQPADRGWYAETLWGAILQMRKAKVGPAPAPSPDPNAPTIALGAYVKAAAWDSTAIDRFAGQAGAAPAIVMWYQDWAHPGHRDFSPTAMDGVVARGAMPLITWEPFDYDGDADQPAYALRTILAGRHDAHIRQWARGAAAWGQPFYLRFAHEMNGNWYPWSPGVNGNTAAEYPAAWRHVVDLFRQEGAHNVRWVWSPNVAGGDSAPFAPLYPGDAYVDWVALDGYNWGTTRPGLTWTDLTAIFGASYDALTALTDKPLMIAETASAEAGGDKGAWITQGLLSELPARFPRVRAVVWFDFKLQTDWQIASSASSLTAFRTVATSSLYSGRLP